MNRRMRRFQERHGVNGKLISEDQKISFEFENAVRLKMSETKFDNAGNIEGYFFDLVDDEGNKIAVNELHDAMKEEAGENMLQAITKAVRSDGGMVWGITTDGEFVQLHTYADEELLLDVAASLIEGGCENEDLFNRIALMGGFFSSILHSIKLKKDSAREGEQS